MSQFVHCHPDYEKGVVWCQHLNGSWAPPFPMLDWQKKQEVGKEETATPVEEDNGLNL